MTLPEAVSVGVRLWKARLLRFAIRTGRIALGVAMIMVAYHIGAWSIETLAMPFAELSPLELIGGLGGGLIALAMVAVAYWVAFGEGDRQEVENLEAQQKSVQSSRSRKDLGYGD